MSYNDDDLDDPEERELAGTQMTFGEHLEELRSRLWRAAIASIMGLIVCFTFHKALLRFVTAPYYRVMEDLNQSTSLKTFAPTQAFISYVKVSFIAGLIVTAPFWVYQLWAFIGAGLYKTERRHIYRYAPLCVVLFAGGVIFGYTLMIPIGLEYLLTFGDPQVIESWVGLSEYLKLFTILTLLLGVAFQVPVVMLGMTAMNVATPASYRKKRRMVILGLFVLAAFFTPPDPVTQVLLAVPLCILYEFGIFLAWLSLGERRSAIDKKALWQRIRVILIIAALLFVARGPLTQWWETRQVDQRLVFEATDSRVGVLTAAALADARGGDEEPFELAYRLGPSAGPNRWVCVRGGRVRVVDETIRRDRVIVYQNTVDPEGAAHVSYAMVPAGQVMFALVMPKAVPYREFVPDLITAMEVGSEDTRVRVAKILGALASQSTEESGDAAISRFRSWYQSHKSEQLLQAP